MLIMLIEFFVCASYLSTVSRGPDDESNGRNNNKSTSLHMHNGRRGQEVKSSKSQDQTAPTMRLKSETEQSLKFFFREERRGRDSCVWFDAIRSEKSITLFSYIIKNDDDH